MAPLMDDMPAARTEVDRRPRFLVIGAGSRGNAYARALRDSGLGIVGAVAEPIAFKRQQFGQRYIWQDLEPQPEQEFDNWRNYLKYEQQRRKDESAGIRVDKGLDGIFVCVLDDQHVEVVTALAPLGLHVLCEKPLATTLEDCLRIQQAVKTGPLSIFAIGHVLRYSPHNMMLRHLVFEQRLIGDVVSLEHTEPVGWWHFSHSYVRGNWRKEATSAPSLLTKSCHDIDFIMWMMTSTSGGRTHLPSSVSSIGKLRQFQKAQKPPAAGRATNCMSCAIQDSCQYSAKRIYYERQLRKGKGLAKHAFWPINIVNPEIESLVMADKHLEAKNALFKSLAEDYDTNTSVPDIEARPWFGRCVWECDNDVVDDQVVTFEWNDEEPGKGSKSAVFHMIAPTLAQCDRRGRIYGTTGEISYDSKTITLHDFTNDETRSFEPELPKNSHHGGGDDGIVQQFVKAVTAVKKGEMSTADAQQAFMGCNVDDVVRSHAAVFAAQEARTSKTVIDWNTWWKERVIPKLVQ